jgi:hypothetical protein
VGTWTGRPHLSILGGKEEDRFTVHLCELLRDTGVLRAFITKICGGEVAPDSTVSPSVQVTVPGGRPDLAIRGDSVYLLLEAKIGAWVHKDHLAPYAIALGEWRWEHPAGGAGLFVLAPQRQMSGIVASAQRNYCLLPTADCVLVPGHQCGT